MAGHVFCEQQLVLGVDGVLVMAGNGAMGVPRGHDPTLRRILGSLALLIGHMVPIFNPELR